MDWAIVRSHPAWRPYTDLTGALPAHRLPTTNELNRLLPEGTKTHSGQSVRFVPAAEITARAGPTPRDYESEISATGQVSTRDRSLHDVCNALVWARFPRTKAALNARHATAPDAPGAGRRGPQRDALTLFDECGAVVTCPERAPLDALARHDWQSLFGRCGEAWPENLDVTVVGHGTLEMFWQPYKAMTARCLLLHWPERTPGVTTLDCAVARLWRAEGPLQTPKDLCPFPLAGMPGWWRGPQDRAFYDDTDVFRPPPAGRVAPPVFSLED